MGVTSSRLAAGLGLQRTSKLSRTMEGEATSWLPLAASLATVGVWMWAALILSSRVHLIHSYTVVPTVPPGWSVWAASVPATWFALLAGVLLGGAILRAWRSAWGIPASAVAWLGASVIIPVLDLGRMLVPQLPLTFAEPLFLALVTGTATARLWQAARPGVLGDGRVSRVVWPLAVVLGAAAAAAWFFGQSQVYYREFLLGYNDFGHFAARVAATWEGRGFLLETPGLPPFWDHCNPGLALLAPLWGLYPGAELFFLMQAVCLAAPAVFVYGLARQWGAPRPAAACWAWGYLCLPAVSQMNLGYTYGWHPVSCALPALFAGLWFLVRGRAGGALVVALVACSFEETVVVAVALFCGVMGVAAWWRRFGGREGRAGSGLLAGCLSPRVWLLASLGFAALFLIEYRFAGFASYQVGRFEKLGHTPVAILMSPLLRPGVFWREVLSSRSAYFLLALALPLGFRRLAGGAAVSAAVALPLILVLAWDRVAAKCIGFQYSTTWLPFLFAAALAGTDGYRPWPSAAGVRGGVFSPWLPAGASVLAACSTASLAIGGMPWSGSTLTDVLGTTYPFIGGYSALAERHAGSPRNRYLNEAVARVRGARAVLATGRIAAHLVGVERLETVGQAVERWALLQAERDGPRQGLARFEWIVMDTCEQFQQQPADVNFILAESAAAGFRLEDRRHGVLLLRRSDVPGSVACRTAVSSPGSRAGPDLPADF